MKTVRDTTYLGDRVKVDRESVAAVTTNTRCGWAMFREHSELLYGRFPIWPKRIAYKNFVRPAILHGSEAWYLKESEIGMSIWTEISTVSVICGV